MPSNISLHLGDCLEVLRSMPADSVDSIVTDPPYGLSFMGKRWDYDVPATEIWRECLRVLKPGGHLLAFAGTRTQHKMAVNIEDAGFEIRDMIAWVYGSGFPKSLDVSKAIDKAAGAERGTAYKTHGNNKVFGKGKGGKVAGIDRTPGAVLSDPPVTESAKQWQGWGTALKPALEPITVARKPLVGTVAENVLEHGTGAINVDGCRVGTEDALGGGAQKRVAVEGKGEGWQRPWMHDSSAVAAHAARVNANVARAEALGRWPANLIHDGSDEVVGLFPQSASASGKIKRAGGFARNLEQRTDRPDVIPDGEGYGDSGSAARFFYCAKANKKDRDEGCEGFEKRLAPKMDGGAFLSENGRDSTKTTSRNHHPTVKPTDLMRYLVRLVTPSNGTVLDPFMGSGSTGKACVLEGFNFVGIEREAEYLAIARARIEAVQAKRDEELPLG